MDNVSDAIASIRDLGSVDELKAASGKTVFPQRPKFNSHIHLPPNFSAFENVAQAVSLTDEQNVRVIGLSNYYDYSVYNEFVALAAPRGIFPIFGLEVISLVDELVAAEVKINDPGNPGRMYICGKGITKFANPSPRAAELLATIRSCDEARMAEMTTKVAELFAAAGVDSEMSEAEFKANGEASDPFVRKFDKWSSLKAFDKNTNGKIDWFEADGYRRGLRKSVLGAYDKNKNTRLQGEERDAANKALASGKVPKILLPSRSSNNTPRPSTRRRRRRSRRGGPRDRTRRAPPSGRAAR